MMHILRFYVALCLLLLTPAARLHAQEQAKPDPQQQKFEELVAKVQKDSDAAQDAEVRQLLELGLQLGRPYAANLAVKSYLARSLSPAPAVLLLAADSAFQSADYRTAVARYKAYLAKASPSAESSVAAGNLYYTLVELLKADDDAYESMKRFGDAHRASAAARRYDNWYLDQAQRRKDWSAMAARLVVALNQKLPLEQERLYYGHHLDSLLRALSRAEDSMFPALADAKKLVPLLREDPRRTAEYQLYVAKLAYDSNAKGKEQAEQEKLFAPVLAAAAAYFKAYPDAEAMKTIWIVYAGGHDTINGRDVNAHRALKQAQFMELFNQLKPADRAEAFAFNNRGYPLMYYWPSPEQQVEVVAANSDLLRGLPMMASLPFVNRTDSPELLKKQAAFLQDVPSNLAAAINACAASDDLYGAMVALIEKQSWNVGPTDIWTLLTSYVWPNFSTFKDAAGKPRYTANDWNVALAKLGKEVASQSPVVVFDPTFTREYLVQAWRTADADALKKQAFIEHLRGLDWVPYDAKTRTTVISGAYDEFKKWTNDLRNRQKKEDAAVTAEVLGQITPLEEAFKKALNPAVTDVKKAPNDYCRKLAESIVAGNDGRAKDYEKVAGELYQMVKEWDVKRPAMAKTVLWALLTTEPQGVDALPLLKQAIIDHVARWQPGQSTYALDYVVNTLMNARSSWRFFGSGVKDKAAMLALNEAFGQALLDLAKRDQFIPQLCDWWRGTRFGNGWTAYESGADVAGVMIEKQLWAKFRYAGIWPSGSTTYQYFIYNRAPGLRDKYPPQSYFDDMYLQECAQTGVFDWQYWAYGHDKDRKIANAVAKQFTGYTTLPLGFGGRSMVYPRDYLLVHWPGRVLNADPAVRDAMLAAAEGAYGKTRFDEYAMGRAYFQTVADVRTADGRKAFFDRLKLYVERAAAQPDRLIPPYMNQLNSLNANDLTDAETDVLLAAVRDIDPPVWAGGCNYETLGLLVHDALAKRGRYRDLVQIVPELWRIGRDTGNAGYQRQLAQAARQLVNGNGNGEDGKPAAAKTSSSAKHDPAAGDLATVHANIGLELMGTELAEDIRTALLSLKSKSLSEIGGVIPVPRGDARWPIYKSQSDFLAGRILEAWESYLSRQELVLNMLKDLDPNYLTWLINQNTDAKRYDVAEQLGKAMLEWTESTPNGFDPEIRAALGVAYANIALARQEYPRARAWFNRIAAAPEFDGTFAQLQAELKMAEVDRVTKQFEAALTRLEKLTRARDRSLQADAYYQLALVRFDQEEYLEARNLLGEVFARMPGHAPGRILEGNLNIRLRNLEEAREVAVGLSADKRFIIPGKPLKVTLEDRNLAIVQDGANIEIRAWTDGGDEEFFALFPKGDSKTKFEGQVATALGAAKKGDRALQLLGNDQVHYNFSPRFIGERDPKEFPTTTLSVVTDGQLFASSGHILTAEEQEEKALEKMIRQRLRVGADHLQRMVLDTERADDQVKPGNKINVRVIDGDRSISNERDELAVTVTTTSGDRLNGFKLKETEPHSGIFEGAIPTSTGQATAYASDSEEGRDPNFAITNGDFPPWVGLADNRRPKTFSVDLNDNVSLGKLVVTSDVPGRKLKDFIVQTSINGRDYVSIGRWPGKHVPWDGSLRLELVKFVRGASNLRTLDDYKSYVERDHLTVGAPKVELEPKQIAGQWNRDLLGKANDMQIGWQDWYIAHYYGAFEVDQTRLRSFLVDTTGDNRNVRYLLAIDGKVGESATRVTRSLSKGVHRLDLFIYAYRHSTPKFELQCDLPEAPFIGPVPADTFDPTAHPLVKEKCWVEPAQITANDAATQFTIAFAPASNARVVRLMLADFETDAPAITRVTLEDTAGRQILPTREDFRKLKQNDQLEIVPGDRITISYDDPKVVDQAKSALSAFLSATFSNAELSACFVEYNLSSGGERQEEFIPMRRFQPGDAVKVFIKDPDADVSDKLDVVEFTVRTEGAEPVTLKALETAEHSGIFMGTALPILEAPQRENEVKIARGEDLLLAYFDHENTDPGVPSWRNYRVEQASAIAPQLRVYDVSSVPLDEKQLTNYQQAQAVDRQVNEYFPVTHDLLAVRPTAPQAWEKPAVLPVDGPLLVELVCPAIARSPNAEASIYVQTSAARALHGAEQGPDDFDVNVPGTIKLTRTPGDPSRIDAPEGYRQVVVRGNPLAAEPLEEGRYTFEVPLAMGPVPDQTLIYEREQRGREIEATPLMVRGSDEIFIGFQYQDEQGQQRWIVQKAHFGGDVLFHAMDRRYQSLTTGLHVGETAYFRVVHKTLDSTDDKDTIRLLLRTASGKQVELPLAESFGHSGIFKGLIHLVYHESDQAKPAAKPEGADAAPAEADAEANAGDLKLPVVYGDVLTAVYAPSGAEPLELQLNVFKGDDGLVLPFTKRFKDPEIAVQTQFTIAEAYLELAKRHRDLGQESLARREIAQGKKLLEEAIRDFPDTEARVQADYLLANLAFEFARDAKNEELARDFYVEAINRFGDIVTSYPDSPYAPKSQYKKALVLEKMGQIDEACEEYVKLSYRYPENELVAETIFRLGNYFRTKGKDFDEKASAATDPIEREKIKIQGQQMFVTAGQVFGRLGVRFPNHRLAHNATAISAQCYMLAEKFDKAIEVFKTVYEDPKADNEVAAECMYWTGDCHMKAQAFVDAYRVFKKLTWDYPESKWAKYARGRLTDDALLRVAEQDADN